MGELLTNIIFFHKLSHIQLNYAFLLFCRILGLLKTSLFSPKRSTEIQRKFVFLNKFEKAQILSKIWICLNNFFGSNQ